MVSMEVEAARGHPRRANAAHSDRGSKYGSWSTVAGGLRERREPYNANDGGTTGASPGVTLTSLEILP